MSLAESTILGYKRVFGILNNEYLRAHQEFDAMRFCHWLADEKFGLASATWRQYRAATLYHIRENYQSEHSECAAFLMSLSQSNRATGIIRSKKKGYSDHEMERLLSYCYSKMQPDRKSSQANGIFWWANVYYSLLAGGLVGLRPCEWFKSEVITTSQSCLLVVENAKTTHGRSHGKTRTIDISELTSEEIDIIKTKITLTRSAVNNGYCSGIDEYQVICRKYLLNANNRVFPGAKKTIAFYSTRHQVVAEYKSREGATAEELAAILGHSSIVTARNHYARKLKSGSTKPKSSKIHADKSDVARVTALNADRTTDIKESAAPKDHHPAPTHKGPDFGI